jgi:hypothetical protein
VRRVVIYQEARVDRHVHRNVMNHVNPVHIFPYNVTYVQASSWPPLSRFWEKICLVCFFSHTHATPSFDQHNYTWHKMLVIPLILTKRNVVHTKRQLWRPRCKWKGRICTCNTIFRHVHSFAWNIRCMCGAVLCCNRRVFFYLLTSAVFLVQISKIARLRILVYCLYLSRRQWDAKVILFRCSYRLLFRPTGTKLEFFGHSLVNTYNLKFQQNPSNGGWVVPCGKTDGRAVTVTKATVVFRSCCTNASKIDLKWIGYVPGIGLK